MTEIENLSLADVLQAFRSRSLLPSELLEIYIDRIERLDSQLNAFVHLDLEGARRQALVADAHWQGNGPKASLLGIPVGIKDIIDVVGMPTLCQSAIRAGHVATRDAAIVAKLRQCGAVILGKLATHEFANGLPSFDLLSPPARNPWNLDHHPGGSSSGAGAAVAAGLVPLAIGTDTGGSVRHPATACGIVGFKPTYELLSRDGVFPLSPTLDHVGILTRNAADAGIVLCALSPDEEPIAPGVISDIRVGIVRHFHTNDLCADAEVASGIEDCVTILAENGADVREVSLSPLMDYFSVNRAILHAEAFRIHADWLKERPQDYGRATLESLLVGAFLDERSYKTALGWRSTMAEEIDAVFSNVDIVVCASAMEPPSRFDQPAETARTYTRQARTPFNITGHPALSVFTRLSRSGLPLGVQFAAARNRDSYLLAAAQAFETARGAAPRPSCDWTQ